MQVMGRISATEGLVSKEDKMDDEDEFDEFDYEYEWTIVDGKYEKLLKIYGPSPIPPDEEIGYADLIPEREFPDARRSVRRH
jgi:hypothetical protein